MRQPAPGSQAQRRTTGHAQQRQHQHQPAARRRARATHAAPMLTRRANWCSRRQHRCAPRACCAATRRHTRPHWCTVPTRHAGASGALGPIRARHGSGTMGTVPAEIQSKGKHLENKLIVLLTTGATRLHNSAMRCRSAAHKQPGDAPAHFRSDFHVFNRHHPHSLQPPHSARLRSGFRALDVSLVRLGVCIRSNCRHQVRRSHEHSTKHMGQRPGRRY